MSDVTRRTLIRGLIAATAAAATASAEAATRKRSSSGGSGRTRTDPKKTNKHKRPMARPSGPVERPKSARAPTRSAARLRHPKAQPVAARRPFSGGPPPRPHRTPDHRFARPHIGHLRPHPKAPHPPPARWTYRPYYTRWWVHPWWRFRYVTVAVVALTFTPWPWKVDWAPPARSGWTWVPGHWQGAVWTPGHWQPVAAAPRGYTYVPGYWMGSIYIDGYWRIKRRRSWVWVGAVYLEDGTSRWPHWRPEDEAPAGYTWESGFWDGEEWVDGFWRPEHRSGFTWVEAWYGEEGVYHAGYWYPLDEEADAIWIPGWFDGAAWIEGYWVDAAEYEEADIESWEPEAGWDDGWEAEENGENGADAPAEPLALPVE